MGLIAKLKTYFKKKDNNETTGAATKGVCHNCWGKEEWEAKYYNFKRGENGNPSEATYHSFVQNVIRFQQKAMIISVKPVKWTMGISINGLTYSKI